MQYENMLIDMINASQRSAMARPVNLGGVAGPSGGVGGPPGGFVGWLPQTRVGYDTDEFALNTTASGATLLDNLNHIRYRLSVVESGGVSGGGHEIVYNGSTLTQRAKLEFIGGVTVVDNPSTNTTVVTIPSGSYGYTENLSSQVPASGNHYTITNSGISDTLKIYVNGVREHATLSGMDANGLGFTIYDTLLLGDTLVVDYNNLSTASSTGGDVLMFQVFM